jgi:predicted ribosomally synthesized peptide with SipW-like signal peptide
MSGFSKVLSAGLLTLAVIGGTGAYLSHSLTATPAKFTADSYVVEQSQMPQTAQLARVNTGRAS